jgi:hypothetical protein
MHPRPITAATLQHVDTIRIHPAAPGEGHHRPAVWASRSATAIAVPLISDLGPVSVSGWSLGWIVLAR